MEDIRDLESHIDETIRQAQAKNYILTSFMQMRERWGTVEAIKRLVVSGDIQSGFTRLVDLGLREHSIDATVLKFPSFFGKDVLASAQWRLKQLDSGSTPHA